MRTVLVTGKGGAGRTTAAAATAVLAARTGLRTLLLGTDPHAALDRMLGTSLTERPTEVEQHLYAARTDGQQAFRDETLAVQDRAAPALDLLGVDPLEPEELIALPGTSELVLLRTLRDEGRSGAWDVLVVDCPDTARLVAALALPAVLRRYLDRLLPHERQAARALRPVLASVAGVPMPAEWLFDAREWADAELAGLQEVPDDPDTTVRLVAAPGPTALADLRQARAGLALHGRYVDAVLANRVLPDGSPDPWLAALAEQQREALEELRRESARPEELAVPVHRLPHAGHDPAGPEELAALAAAAYGAVPGPVARPPAEWAAEPFTVESAGAGAERRLTLRLPLPGADRDGLDLSRCGDELVVGIGPYRRMLPLPAALRRCSVAGASLKGGVLAVRFRPDPGLWPVP